MHSYVESIITPWNAFCTYINGVGISQTAIPQSNTTNANFQVIMTVSKVIGRLICKLANHTVTTDAYYTCDEHFKVIAHNPTPEV